MPIHFAFTVASIIGTKSLPIQCWRNAERDRQKKIPRWSFKPRRLNSVPSDEDMSLDDPTIFPFYKHVLYAPNGVSNFIEDFMRFILDCDRRA